MTTEGRPVETQCAYQRGVRPTSCRSLPQPPLNQSRTDDSSGTDAGTIPEPPAGLTRPGAQLFRRFPVRIRPIRSSSIKTVITSRSRTIIYTLVGIDAGRRDRTGCLPRRSTGRTTPSIPYQGNARETDTIFYVTGHRCERIPTVMYFSITRNSVLRSMFCITEDREWKRAGAVCKGVRQRHRIGKGFPWYNTEHMIRVEVAGNEYRAYVDGELVVRSGFGRFISQRNGSPPGDVGSEGIATFDLNFAVAGLCITKDYG